MNQVFLLLGSNQQDPARQLQKARTLINKKLGTIQRKSAIYATAAWGKRNQPDFLNQVLILYSQLQGMEIMEKILAIEKEMGRVRTLKNAPRIIDIDILFINKEQLGEPGLTVPHPHIADRRFVLTPLNELVPQWKHPVYKKSIHELLRICRDKLPVKKL